MKKTFYICFAIILIMNLNSCKKEGCTDINANNFNYLAKKDDGSCQYNLQSSTLEPLKLFCIPEYGTGTTGEYHLVNYSNRPIDYLIDCQVYIKAPLTIDPGVVIEFTENGGITFKEGVTAIGTISEPIIFKSTSNQKGSWNGIEFEVANDSAILKYVSIENATNTENVLRSSLRISASTTSQIIIENCTISGSLSFGLYLSYIGPNVNLQVSNLEISDCESPLLIAPTLLDSISNLTLTNNTYDYIDLIPQQYNENISIPFSQYPYRIAYSQSVSFKTLGVYNFKTFNISPGVTILFGDSYGIDCEGTFIAQGSASDSIKFLGTTPTNGFWKSIRVNAVSSPILDFVEIGYAGQPGNNAASLDLYGYGGTASITNSYIHNSGSCGIYNAGTVSLITTGTTFTNVTQNICP